MPEFTKTNQHGYVEVESNPKFGSKHLTHCNPLPDIVYAPPASIPFVGDNSQSLISLAVRDDSLDLCVVDCASVDPAGPPVQSVPSRKLLTLSMQAATELAFDLISASHDTDFEEHLCGLYQSMVETRKLQRRADAHDNWRNRERAKEAESEMDDVLKMIVVELPFLQGDPTDLPARRSKPERPAGSGQPPDDSESDPDIEATLADPSDAIDTADFDFFDDIDPHDEDDDSDIDDGDVPAGVR